MEKNTENLLVLRKTNLDNWSMTLIKALSHYSMDFKQFKPMHLVPIGFTAPGQIDKMKEFISKLVISSSSTIKVNNF